jgi:hypothetical protein
MSTACIKTPLLPDDLPWYGSGTGTAWIVAIRDNPTLMPRERFVMPNAPGKMR